MYFHFWNGNLCSFLVYGLADYFVPKVDMMRLISGVDACFPPAKVPYIFGDKYLS